MVSRRNLFILLTFLALVTGAISESAPAEGTTAESATKNSALANSATKGAPSECRDCEWMEAKIKATPDPADFEKLLVSFDRQEITSAKNAIQYWMQSGPKSPGRRSFIFRTVRTLSEANPLWTCEDSKAILAILPATSLKALDGALEARSEFSLKEKCPGLFDVSKAIALIAKKSTDTEVSVALLTSIIETRKKPALQHIQSLLKNESFEVRTLAIEWLRHQPEVLGAATVPILLSSLKLRPVELQTRVFEVADRLPMDEKNSFRTLFLKQNSKKCESFKSVDTQSTCNQFLSSFESRKTTPESAP